MLADPTAAILLDPEPARTSHELLGFRDVFPLRPRRLVITSIIVIVVTALGIAVLAWPLPSPPETGDAVDTYAAELAASPRVRALDPDGHARLLEAREHGDVLDAARELRSAIRLPRWTAVFAFLLCGIAGAMCLWRARRASAGDGILREAVGLAVFATTLSMLFVGWTSIVTSTLVTTVTAGSAGALMISGRVMPQWLAGTTSRQRHAMRIALGLLLALGGVIGRRTLAPDIHAEAGAILLHAVPMLVCTFALVGGVLLAASNVAVMLLRR
jgi:hypothetical protein